MIHRLRMGSVLQVFLVVGHPYILSTARLISNSIRKSILENLIGSFLLFFLFIHFASIETGRDWRWLTVNDVAVGTHQGRPADWMDAVGKEVTLWQNVIERAGLWFEGSLPLRHAIEEPVGEWRSRWISPKMTISSEKLSPRFRVSWLLHSNLIEAVKTSTE